MNRFNRLILLSFACIASTAHAQDIRWLAASNGAWSTAASWFNSLAPGAGTATNDVYIDYTPYALTGGVNNFTTTLNYAASVKRLFSRAAFTLQSNNLTLGADGSIISGTFTMQAGGLLGGKTIAFNGPVVLETGNAKTIAGIITTTSTATLTGAYLLLTNSTLNIAGTSAWTITGDYHLYDGVINNSGSITKTGGTGTAYLNINSGGGTKGLNNTGTIASNAGTLELREGGAHTGTFSASAGNFLFFNGGAHTFTGSTINGTGVIFGNGAAKYTWSGTNTLVNSPEFRDGIFAGTGTLTGGTLRLTSSSKVFQDSLTRAGATSFEAGSCYASNATFHNQGVFSITGDLAWYDGIFDNTGTIQKTAGAGTASLCSNSSGGPRQLNNSGTVTSSSGVLALYGNGTSTGTYASSGSGSVRFLEGTWNMNAGTTFGAGDVGIQGATFLLNANIAAQNFAFVNGVLTGTGNFTTNGLMTWSNGTLTGTGTWNPKGATNLITGSAKSCTRPITNDGTFNFQAGPFYLTNGSFTNKSIFDFQGDVTLYDGAFTNNLGATVKKSSGLNTAYIGYPSGGGTTSFNNAGTVISNSGTIQVQAGGTHTGSFSALAGADVRFPANTQSFQAGSTAGNNCIFNGCTATFTGAVNFGTVNFDSGTFNGTGTLSGGTLTMQTGSSKVFGGSLTRTGTTNWSQGPIYLTNATLNNQGSFNMIGDLALYDGIFNNSGTFAKTGGAGIGYVALNSGGGTRQFNNTGTVNVTSGRLQIYGGGTHTGTFTTSGTGKIRFQDGLHNINAGAVFGAGDNGLDGSATVTINSATNAQNFTIEGGTFNGTGNLTCSGLLEFDGGTAAGTGQLNANAGLAFRQSGTKTLTKVVNASGPSSFEGGSVQAANSTFNNNGTFDYKGDFAYYDGIFNNKSALTKSSGAGTAYMCYPSGGGTSQFNNTGSVNVLTGSLDIRGNGSHKGSFAAVAPATVVFPAGTQTFQTGCTFGNGVTFNGVTATFQGSQTLTGNVSWTAGQFKGSASFDGGKFLWSGSRDLKNAPIFNSDVEWSSGQVAGNTSSPTFNGNLDLTGDTTFYDGYITNNGTITKSNGTGTSYFSYPNTGGLRGFFNAGTVEVKKGTIQISSGFSNFDPFSGVLTGGQIIVQDGCTLQYTNSHGAIVDNRARIVLNGATSAFRQNNNTEALLGCKFNYGSISGLSARSITVATPFETSGDVTMATGGTFTVPGASVFNQTNGKTVIDGTLAAATTTITGGLFSGAGTVNGVVTNTSGTVAPGNLVGPLTIATSYTQGAAGKMLARINSAAPGDFGMIATGNATLAGALAVTVLPGATVTTGQKFRILTCTGTRTGTFSPGPDSSAWTVTYNTKYVELTAKKTIVGTASIAGNLTLSQFKGNNVAQPITFELWNGNTLVETQIVYVQPSGDFEFFTTQTGTFDIKAKASHWLRQSQNGVDVSSGVSGLNYNLINGDVDNSNGIGTDDYLILNSSFGLNFGDAGYDARADLDGDFSVTSDDYLILNANFDSFGD